MSGTIEVATLVAALGCGLVGGVFFAFSTVVMPALDRLPSHEGTAAMQSINRLGVNPPFLVALFGAAIFGTALVCLPLIVWAVDSWDEVRAPWVLAGSALYLLIAIGVTIAANVPLNDALARIDPTAADAASRWSSYVGDWTLWNHVRAVAAFAAAGLLTVALALEPDPLEAASALSREEAGVVGSGSARESSDRLVAHREDSWARRLRDG